MESKKFSFFNFLLDGVVAFATGALTFLIARDELGVESGPMVAAGISGLCAGSASCLGYEFGMNSWSSRKYNVISGMVGAVVGAACAALIGLG